MKHTLTRTIAAFALSSLLFASVASAVVTDPVTDPYTDDASVSVTLTGALNAEGKVDLSWGQYQGGDLKWYKVVHSTDNADAKYPMDGYVAVYTDPAETTYTHTGVSQGTNYYRVCVITTADLRGCSNTVTIEKDGATVTEEPVSDPYTDDETIVVTLNGELTTEGKAALTWTKYEEGDLKWYKVVHSQTNDAAYYPVDGYVHVSSDFMANTYTHTSVLEGTNHYRVCVITTADMRGCSNTITLEKGESTAVKTFDDVADDHWAKDYIEDLANKEIIEGRDGMFEPESPILRAEALKLVMYGVGLDGASCDSSLFPDLGQEDWFCEVVTKAYTKGIIKGDNGYLYPGREITRAEAVKILLEAKGLEPPTLTENPFDDVYLGDWYAGYVYKAFKLGYVIGVGDGMFEPNRSITRAEMAKIVSIATQ
jgi:S-layer homology domain